MGLCNDKAQGSDEVIAPNMVVSTPDASQCIACVLQASRVDGHMLQFTQPYVHLLQS